MSVYTKGIIVGNEEKKNERFITTNKITKEIWPSLISIGESISNI